MAADNTAKKQRGKPFPPGKSGNPAGRPKGSRNVTTLLLESLLDADGEVILKKLIGAAKDGKPWALRMSIDRLLPIRRDRRLELAEMVGVRKAEDVAQAVGDIIERVAAGEISIDDGQAFLRLLEVQRKAIETAELAVRLQVLEDAGVEGASAERERFDRRKERE